MFRDLIRKLLCCESSSRKADKTAAAATTTDPATASPSAGAAGKGPLGGMVTPQRLATEYIKAAYRTADSSMPESTLDSHIAALKEKPEMKMLCALFQQQPTEEIKQQVVQLALLLAKQIYTSSGAIGAAVAEPADQKSAIEEVPPGSC
eukprot:Protomagalhaensia_sp_Gyna_25__27@NODE_1014_length_2293_cov_75_554570_g546_i1_p3_GENE_NODE_1014_length_2293_cov_75_554570_g546_i1NODE_1014_length_2293_cov_75_554570_g546_i1_p3_ORF_typecomplete_len149_score29_67ALMS_repeat/PF18727_1/3_3e03ALMS_repeat/PF18727_1/0_078_NODE_1014_length_2293_cov_75_554570_g546_i19281374